MCQGSNKKLLSWPGLKIMATTLMLYHNENQILLHKWTRISNNGILL